ncbi:hypothetical protein AV530_012190 [Patagioenas fasciata monilis]|uniref:Uncharacterized protein n=1 Tax=Patagioenas fasciata monilis TaxID=372326 RepID=A0A1V4KFB3_PATFA|nr:hypothetical protein AV530_012190 [Patagioenas fasciata monilis]
MCKEKIIRQKCDDTSPVYAEHLVICREQVCPRAALRWRGAQCELLQRGVVMLPCQRLRVSPQRLMLSPEVQSEKSSTD